MKVFVLLILGLICCNVTHANAANINLVFASEMPEINGNNHYSRLASLLAEQRKNQPNTFFFFGGGSLGPSVLSSLDQGSHIIDLLNSLEPDAMGVSKREFSFYAANLSLRAYDATFPIVASNILESATNEALDGILTSSITQHGQLRVGFLSIIDNSVIEDYTFRQIMLTPPKQAIIEQANKLRQRGADLVVLHYTGYYPVINELLEQQVIDLSLHKDESYKQEQYKDRVYHSRDVFIKRPQDIAIVSLTRSSNSGVSLTSRFVDVNDYAVDKTMQRQVMDYMGRLKTLLDVEIGRFNVAHSTRRELVRNGENPFGNYIADSIRRFANAQLAIVNSGFIRGDREYRKDQKITRGLIVNELPYRNKVVLVELTGQQLVQALESAFTSLEFSKGRFPQISGFTITFDSDAPVGKRVKSVKIKQQEIMLSRVYRVATTDYLAAGGDGYEAFRKAKNINEKHLAIRLVSDIVMDSIMDDKIITPTLDGRIIDLKSKH